MAYTVPPARVHLFRNSDFLGREHFELFDRQLRHPLVGKPTVRPDQTGYLRPRQGLINIRPYTEQRHRQGGGYQIVIVQSHLRGSNSMHPSGSATPAPATSPPTATPAPVPAVPTLAKHAPLQPVGRTLPIHTLPATSIRVQPKRRKLKPPSPSATSPAPSPASSPPAPSPASAAAASSPPVPSPPVPQPAPVSQKPPRKKRKVTIAAPVSTSAPPTTGPSAVVPATKQVPPPQSYQAWLAKHHNAHQISPNIIQPGYWYGHNDMLEILSNRYSPNEANIMHSWLVSIQPIDTTTYQPVRNPTKKQKDDQRDIAIHQINMIVDGAIDDMEKNHLPTIAIVHVDHNHWVTFVIRERPDGSYMAFYADSFGHPINDDNESGLFRDEFVGRLPGIDIIEIHIKQQTDGSSCGAYAIANAIAFVAIPDTDLTIKAGEAAIRAVARKTALRLRQEQLQMQLPIPPAVGLHALTSYRRPRAAQRAAIVVNPPPVNLTPLPLPPNLKVINGERQNQKVRVADSTIPDAGEGLFAIAQFQEDEEICKYKGRRLTAKQAQDSDSKYIWGNNRKGSVFLAIDAADPQSCYGRYANDPLDKGMENVKIEQFGFTVALYALRPIAIGEEIFVEYGKEYWFGSKDYRNFDPKLKAQILTRYGANQ